MLQIPSALMPAIMTVRGSKMVFRSANALHRRVNWRLRHPVASAPPRALSRTVDVRLVERLGWLVYEISPLGGRSQRRALYLHGGAYVFQISVQHWWLVARLAAATGTRFVVPVYSLPPADTAVGIVEKATQLAAELIAEVGSGRTSLLGDSAGGGMALAVAMQLRDRGHSSPHATVLISPWLDVSGTDPAIALIAPSDPWLAVPGSRAAGAIYRGELAEDDPRVSPIHGDLSGLGPITLFSGTRDILNADARRLVRLANEVSLPIDFHEIEGMLHVYPLLPIREADAAFDIICRALGE